MFFLCIHLDKNSDIVISDLQTAFVSPGAEHSFCEAWGTMKLTGPLMTSLQNLKVSGIVIS